MESASTRLKSMEHLKRYQTETWSIEKNEKYLLLSIEKYHDMDNHFQTVSLICPEKKSKFDGSILDQWTSRKDTLWWFNIAIENGPVEIVDFPINSMVIFHSYVKLPEGMYTIASGKLTVGTLWFSPQFRSGFTNLPSPDAWQGLSLLIYCCVTWRVLYEY